MASERTQATPASRGPTLRSRLAAGERLTGALVRMPSEEVVEMLAVAGLDFVLIDCEHGPADLGMLRHHIALAQVHRMPVLVRIGEREHLLALRALDQGAQGVVAPHVDSVADADALVRAVHYPPLGARGFATYPRAGAFGTVTAEEHRSHAAESTLVLAMLESPAAIREAGAIVGREGIDGYLVGVADLGASRTAADPGVEQLLAEVRRDPSTAGVVRADLASSTAAAAEAFADGATMVVYNLTHLMMELFGSLRA